MGKKKRDELCDVDGPSNQCVGKITETFKGVEKTIPVIIGLDISTTCTGVCVLHAQTGALIKLFPVKFTEKGIEDFWDKVTHITKMLFSNVDPEWDIRAVAVEENAKRFTPGFSSADTILTLAKFNGIVCHIMYENYGIKPTYINVRSARAKVGIKIDTKIKTTTTKQKVLAQVFNLNPNFPWVYRNVNGAKSLIKINEDLADSWVIAAATRKMFPGLTK